MWTVLITVGKKHVHCKPISWPLSFHFVLCKQQPGSYDEKCRGYACKTNYGVSHDLMFCNTAIAQRWKFKRCGKSCLLINTFNTHISHRQLISQQKSNSFSIQYSVFFFCLPSVTFVRAPFHRKAVKPFICLSCHVGVTRIRTSVYVTPFKFKESSLSPMCTNGRQSLECCGASLWPIARHVSHHHHHHHHP